MASTSDTVPQPRPVISAPAVEAPGARERRRRPSGEPPPLPRSLNTSGRTWLLTAIAALAVCVIVALLPGSSIAVDVIDHRILEGITALRADWLTTVMRLVGWLASALALQIAWLASLLILIVFRRWRHLAVMVLASLSVSLVTIIASEALERPRPVGFEILGHWEGAAMPSRPMAILAMTLINILYSLVPQGHWRQVGKVIAGVILAAVAFSRLYLAQDGPSDILVGLLIGVAAPLTLWRLLVPSDVFPVRYSRGRTAHLDVSGSRGQAIVKALTDQLGVRPLEVKPFGLAGSGGSTPMRVKISENPKTYLFCKLYAANHLRSDRWYKIGRQLLYGRLEDEAPFATVRQLVQYEDYTLRLLYDAGLPVPRPYGIVEITPEREYLLAMEFFHGSKELGEVEVDDHLIAQGLELVRALWDAGLAHRDIKPANLLVNNRQLVLIDCAFAEIRPSPWRQAVDLANMMLVLALGSEPERVLAHAREHFSDREIAEAFAATRGITMPSQIRRLMKERGRDLHKEFLLLLPERLPPIAIQRWSLRRVMLLVGVVLLALILAVPTWSIVSQSPL